MRALRAGADVVLVDPGDGPGPVVDAVAAALGSGRYPRSAAVASARRVLAAKGALHAPSLSSPQPVTGATATSLVPVLSAVGRDPVAQAVTVSFWVRRPGDARYALQGASATAASGARAAVRVPAGRLLPATTYVWTARACTAAGRCSPSTPEQRFTTAPPTGTPGR